MTTFTCLGGGHGLYQTLLACRSARAEHINAVVTVADDGGSSGRLRRELGMIPPGDLRMALSALMPDTDTGRLWRNTLQHRFQGNGAMAGHAVGNLLLAGLSEKAGGMQAALDVLTTWAGANGRVIPVCNEPLEIEADVAGLDDDPRVLRSVRGQVAVATTPGSVRRVRILPADPPVNSAAIAAVMNADVVTIGPGSWFSSVIPHLLMPDVVTALNETAAKVIVVLNLSPEAGETQGFTTERHIHLLSQHAPGLRVDHFLADSNVNTTPGERTHLQRTAQRVGGEITYTDVRTESANEAERNVHDPAKLAAALLALGGAS
ncbi:gluconeogenesis factor YvcK family protein [Corynebacterium sanguinis]|uniref:gluconeogenesis factor YvcK family protein n=1 Tax=Corynebacterium TaxID=1716 RepID=UPI00223C3BAC|nr:MULTISPECIES: uridine diphosphate-N-acetylglucosamine-binding protein YvcK [Corynebacterium]MCT1413484.1 uridine diphosphate-N-acetylglucosamine-binding protein YvcK [Corynebacterium sanguinis]MCT2022890.1 uridine diphosphate-N-acetylglucosamine-binding protein YvcK [Corynebacterium sanguinis]MCT2046498.1 uridine diphosphate-N-acetylglucosamine-binding protein YvcK [Corynebacterium sanguinis]WNI12292.1 uridine diphosphate-N-acetylglucosamine-binding protein YvcK [Corynebacterium sp. Z-1]